MESHEITLPSSEYVTEELAAGIFHVSTPHHGYIILSSARLAEMPDVLKTQTDYYDGSGRFEEDIEWARVILAFPYEFEGPDIDNAERIMLKYHPSIYRLWEQK